MCELPSNAHACKRSEFFMQAGHESCHYTLSSIKVNVCLNRQALNYQHVMEKWCSPAMQQAP